MMPLPEIDLKKHIWSLQQQIQLRQAELKKLERSLAKVNAQQTVRQATRPALTNHQRLAIEPIEVLGLTLRTASATDPRSASLRIATICSSLNLLCLMGSSPVRQGPFSQLISGTKFPGRPA
jgi:hypothetical protein